MREGRCAHAHAVIAVRGCAIVRTVGIFVVTSLRPDFRGVGPLSEEEEEGGEEEEEKGIELGIRGGGGGGGGRRRRGRGRGVETNTNTNR
uniref:Uncharacterized protein n=1 Tax=Vespula pensylvanica TaxID=30213 RepID=A0A834U4V5_VESPE|nr:hypothetical protein H0235_011186 [Vespula pensylvanica]